MLLIEAAQVLHASVYRIQMSFYPSIPLIALYLLF